MSSPVDSVFKLITEQPFYDFEKIVEEKNINSPSTMFISGPFLMAEKRNRNGRIYPIGEMVTEANRYRTDFIEQGRAFGELNHPTTAEVNPERACHLMTELTQKDNMFYGRSKILNSPLGNLVKNLLLDGVKLGVSSRALGRITESDKGNLVSNLRLVCVDVVADPSVDKAFVNGVLESRQWIFRESTGHWFEQAADTLEKGLTNLPAQGTIREAYLAQMVIQFIRGLS